MEQLAALALALPEITTPDFNPGFLFPAGAGLITADCGIITG